MASYTAPSRDLQFVLQEVIGAASSTVPGYDELSADVTLAILQEAGKLAENVLAPLNAVGDTQGCHLKDGIVTTPEGFGDAYAQMRAGGWIGLDCDPEYGGQGMPHLMHSAVGEILAGANMAFNMYQGLSHGAYGAIHAHGDAAQKRTYLPRIVDGSWSGTMNLTEPQCGTDLGLIRTKAEPQAGGSYEVTGQKIWISSGEHDLTDNIIHLVLAKIPGGPEGVKGLSLFIVPKFLVEEGGTLGARNSVTCGGLESKMGIHGNATCVMNFDGATGYLIGEAHKGLRAMFTMMNDARLGVGVQGYSQAVRAYQTARDFARDRLQGRDVTGTRNPGGPADPIIVHPDVRRNLMDQKAFVEGARAFAMWGAHLLDRSHRGGDAEAEAMISLLTPVIKGFLTDKGFDSTVLAQQTFGGSGYTRDWGVEQQVRDARITMVYEGTNGIQSLDLVGRKLGQNGGKTLMAFVEEVKAEIASAKDDDRRAPFAGPLKAASKDLQAAATWFMQNGMKDPNQALAGSYDFMHLFGHTCLGLMWTRMAAASLAALDAGAEDPGFYETKLATGRHYMARHLPATALHLTRIQSGAGTVMALAAEDF